MPSVGGVSKSYYILDGKRLEVDEVDVDWANDNCEIQKQEVW